MIDWYLKRMITTITAITNTIFYHYWKCSRTTNAFVFNGCSNWYRIKCIINIATSTYDSILIVNWKNNLTLKWFKQKLFQINLLFCTVFRQMFPSLSGNRARCFWLQSAIAKSSGLKGSSQPLFIMELQSQHLMAFVAKKFWINLEY